jgi:hypothetical protein
LRWDRAFIFYFLGFGGLRSEGPGCVSGVWWRMGEGLGRVVICWRRLKTLIPAFSRKRRVVVGEMRVWVLAGEGGRLLGRGGSYGDAETLAECARDVDEVGAEVDFEDGVEEGFWDWAVVGVGDGSGDAGDGVAVATYAYGEPNGALEVGGFQECLDGDGDGCFAACAELEDGVTSCAILQNETYVCERFNGTLLRAVTPVVRPVRALQVAPLPHKAPGTRCWVLE